MSLSDIRATAACAAEARLHRSSEEDITVLIDTDESYTQPTGKTSAGLWRILCDRLCLESESEAVRVGESESVRGATTMRETERETESEVWGRETERGYVRREVVCCVRQWGTRVRTEKVWAEMREWGWGGWRRELKNEGVRVCVLFSYIYI